MSDTEWGALHAERALAQRMREELLDLNDVGINIEPWSGIIESFDREKGYGYILMEDGERALCWQAFRILSLGAD